MLARPDQALRESGYLAMGGQIVDATAVEARRPRLTLRANGTGEISFSAVQASLDFDHAPSMLFFTWSGLDEMDEVTCTGSAELLDDGSLGIEFACHLGDEAVLKSVRGSSSTPCWAIEERQRSPAMPALNMNNTDGRNQCS